MTRKARIAVITATVIAGGIALFFIVYTFPKDHPLVTNFEECVTAGYKVLDTTPRRCEIAKGLTIVEQAPMKCPIYSFEQFRTKGEVFTGTPATVDFSTYDVPTENRQTLIDGAKRGPNFAGRYTIVRDSCGAECHVILDAKTGRIIVYGVNSSYGIEFRKDSALIVINTKANIPSTLPEGEKKGLTTEYWRFENASMFNECNEPFVR